MKALILCSSLLTSAGFAQNLDLSDFKKLLTQRQVQLEFINEGMSKKLITNSVITNALGTCDFTETSVQTVLKIEGSKVIIHSKVIITAADTPACKEGNVESGEATILFYEEKPTLAADLADLDASANEIRSLSKSSEIITMNLELSETKEALSIKYDLRKPSFKNMISTHGKNFSIISQDMADIDVQTLDLTNVVFCASSDSEDCVEGNFSDILF